ncbi:hypothetical protein TrLO_g6406 [Triparma laevis f. longispina]|uniref:Uncharacterized protein n=1 Tax=Triparma laevis f. longispina TaxID=1714387 RepID=A0A9W6ZPY6_9STRA|nr:hypothetical protein TrLO_g6406 [Triparma laevis f. longispina]
MLRTPRHFVSSTCLENIDMKIMSFFERSSGSSGRNQYTTNLWYMQYLLRRPYASHRPSSKLGDPMNDAEMLTTRTVSLAAAIFSLRDTLATNTASGDGFAQWFTTNY